MLCAFIFRWAIWIFKRCVTYWSSFQTQLLIYFSEKRSVTITALLVIFFWFFFVLFLYLSARMRNVICFKRLSLLAPLITMMIRAALIFFSNGASYAESIWSPILDNKFCHFEFILFLLNSTLICFVFIHIWGIWIATWFLHGWALILLNVFIAWRTNMKWYFDYIRGFYGLLRGNFFGFLGIFLQGIGHLLAYCVWWFIKLCGMVHAQIYHMLTKKVRELNSSLEFNGE